MQDKRFTFGVLGIISFLIMSGSSVVAKEHGSRDGEAPETVQPSENPSASSSPTASPEGKSKHQLVEGKLKSCQAREAAIIKRSTQMTDRATMMEGKFTDVATKVEAYYTNRLVPSGKTITTYVALTGDITTKKAAVDLALSTTKTDVASFTCTSSDPKAAITSFRTGMMSVKSALKEYRTSIKNLIQAVHQDAGDSEKNTASPSPSVSPTAIATATTSPTPSASVTTNQ